MSNMPWGTTRIGPAGPAPAGRRPLRFLRAVCRRAPYPPWIVVRPLAAAVGAATLFSAAAAWAEEAEELPYTEPERRNGFILGLLAGGAIGHATGNPEPFAQRHDPAFTTATGAAFGYRWSAFLGGALTDWFNFGLGLSSGRLVTSDFQTDATTFLVRVEAFPLYSWGGSFRDLGLGADFGAGTTGIRDRATQADVAESGVMSTVGFGAFWEPVRVWQLAGGPYIAYQHNWSRWFYRNDVAVGLRLMFYGGP